MNQSSPYQQTQQKIRGYETRLADAAGTDRVDVMNALARILFVYEPDAAINYARKGRALATQTGYEHGIALSLINEALCCRLKSDFKKSKQLSRDALKLFEALADKKGQADALNNIAFMEVNLEDYENALKNSAKALPLAQESGDKEIEGFSCLINGMVYELLGDYPRAIEFHMKSLALTRESDDASNEGAALIQLGNVFRKIGEREKARDHFERANKLFEELRIQLLEASAKFNLGKIYSEFGEYERALESLNQSLRIQKSIGHAQGQGACYITIGQVLQKMRNFVSAEENIRQSIELSRSFGKKNYESKGMIQLAECYLDQGNEREAIHILQEAFTEAEIFGTTEIRYQILSMLSRACEIKGDFRRAFTFYKNATALKEELINEESTLKNKSLMILHEVETAHREKQLAVRDKERAEQSEKFKEQFLANMSHEIRTPMNAIAGLADLLGNTTMSPLQIKYVKAIRQSADNLLSIIQDILDFSKIEAGETSLDVINFSVRECLEDVYNTLRYRAEEKSISLTYACDNSFEEIVSGDPMRLKQILINLVGNAIKFTEKGSVSIQAFLLQSIENVDWISFEVSDTGIGIPEDKLDDIFKSFVQASASTTRKFGGTGLGLSISKHLVELQGGKISVRSKIGEGTTFTFSIPYKKATADERKKVAKSTEISMSLNGLRILLVEDNQFNQMVAVDSLTSITSDTIVDVAENGKEAIEKIHQKSFDLILLDLQMPEMDGYETTEIIRRDALPAIREIPIIALTANATKTEKDKCLKLGMNGYVSKPFKTEDLLHQIKQVLSATTSSPLN